MSALLSLFLYLGKYFTQIQLLDFDLLYHEIECIPKLFAFRKS